MNDNTKNKIRFWFYGTSNSRPVYTCLCCGRKVSYFNCVAWKGSGLTCFGCIDSMFPGKSINEIMNTLKEVK